MQLTLVFKNAMLFKHEENMEKFRLYSKKKKKRQKNQPNKQTKNKPLILVCSSKSR